MQRCCFGRISHFPFLTFPLTIRPQHVEQHRQREAAEHQKYHQDPQKYRALAPVVCRLDWNWELNYKGITNPPIHKVDKNLRKPSEFFKSNIYVDSMGPSAICLKAMIETCGVDRVLFGTDFGPVPMSPKLHIDLVDDTIPDAGDRNKIFSTNTLALLRLAENAPRLVPQAA
jgi:hypothetical protein